MRSLALDIGDAWWPRVMCWALLLTQPRAQAAEQLSHSATLDPFGKFVMFWTPMEDEIIIELQVATRGYVGVGFSPSGGMKGADIILGWVDDAGDVHISDRHGTANRTPVLDVSQDVRLLGGGRNGSHVTVRFSRAWVTCDEADDAAITTDTVRVIYAYDDEIPARDSATLPYHDSRGVKSLLLKTPPTVRADPSVTKAALFWDVRASNVVLPSNFSTLYWCQLFQLPQLDRKHHYIGYEPLLGQASEGLVHHMLLYECHLTPSTHLLRWVGASGAQCYTPNMPLSWRACNTPLLSWAVGSEGMLLPPHVGIPLGEHDEGTTFYMLEIHYNNPQKTPNVRDSSGVRVFYTSELRQHDAGTLVVGHGVDPTQVIAPRKSSWTSLGHCSAQCTAQGLPREGVKIIAGSLHAHTIASQLELLHVREMRQLPPYLRDGHYDFNFQQERVLQQEQLLLPGDHLIASCSYDSSARPNPTFGGFGAADEMCLVYLTYYPRTALSDCYSKPSLAAFLRAIGVQQLFNEEEFQRDPVADAFSPEMIDSDLEERLGRVMADSPAAGLPSMDVSMSWYLHKMKIQLPLSHQNKSVLERLYEESLWEDPSVTQALQEVYTRGSYYVGCLTSGRQALDQVAAEGEFPKFASHNSVAHACVSSPVDTSRDVRVASGGFTARQKNEAVSWGGLHAAMMVASVVSSVPDVTRAVSGTW